MGDFNIAPVDNDIGITDDAKTLVANRKIIVPS